MALAQPGLTWRHRFRHRQQAQQAPGVTFGSVTIGTVPQMIASGPGPGPPGGRRRPCAGVYLTNDSVALYLGGGPGVSAANGAAVAPYAQWPGVLFPGDQLWAVTAAGATTISIMQT